MKRTKRLIAMLLTLILCVGEISSTGLRVFAAGNEANDVIGEEVSDDTETVGIGTKFYINDTLPETDAYFYICVNYFEHGYQYVGMPSKIVNDKLRIPQYVIDYEPYRWYYFPGVTEMRCFETNLISIYTTDHYLPYDLPIEDCMKTIGLEVNGGSGTEKDPFTLQPIYAGSDQPYVAVILNDNLDGKLTDRFFVKNGEKPTIPENPSIDGKVFTGWFTDKECTEKFDFETVLTDNIVLYAGWKNDSSYKYDLWVGDIRVTGDNITSIPCDSGTASYDPDKNTLTFKDAVINKGYEYSEGSGRYAAVYTKDSSLTIKGDLTIDPTVLPSGGNAFRAIYAESSEYKGNTLELDADIAIKGYSRGISTLYTDVRIAGGVLDLETTKSVVVIQDAKLDLADGVEVISPDGAAFREVTHGDTKATELFESATSDTSVTKATIGSTKPSYTVTFDMNGHGDAIDAVKVTEGKTVAEPAEPKAEGYTFEGWYKEKECTNKWDFANDTVTEDITLYAKWTGVQYTVTFDMGGKAANIEQKVENGKNATKPETPTAEGFKFIDWYKDAAFTTLYDFSAPITADTTIYAKWVEDTAVTYTVSFNANGVAATGMPADQTVEDGKTATKPATDPAAEGYMFEGWYEEAACTNKYSFDTPVTEDITIYAKWSKIVVPGPVSNHSPLDPKPEIKDDTTQLWLVKGQKFTLQGWSLDDSDKDKLKAYKKLISISKKGKVSAKKPGDAVIVKKDAEGNIVQTVSVNICKPELTSKKLNLEAGVAGKDEGSVKLKNADNIDVYYYSTAPDVAIVFPDGSVKAVAKGSAKVMAYANGTAYTATVSVKEPGAVKERTLHLSLDSKPKTVKLKGVKKTVWEYAEGTTDDEKAVVEIKNAKVTAKKAGTVTLTAKGDLETYTMTVKVDDPTIQPAHADGKYDIKAGKGKNKYELIIKSGEELDISYADLDQPVVFKSNKPETAFIDEDGHIEARSSGKAKFTAKVNGKTITISVKVE